MIPAQLPFVGLSVTALLAALYLVYERDYGRPRWVRRIVGGRRGR